MKRFSKNWYELEDHRKRLFSKSVWIPIYGTIHPILEGEYPDIGYQKETLAVGSAVIKVGSKNDVEDLEWSYWSPSEDTPYVEDDGNYHQAGIFYIGGEKEVGFRLVLTQFVNPNHPRTVFVNQDFLLAYNLIEEGGDWLRPSDGYEKVIRTQRNENDEIIFVEIRSEYLRDYLAARNSLLRLYMYRERITILKKKPDFDCLDHLVIDDKKHDRCEMRCDEIDQSGDIPGATWAVFQTWRTDVDPEVDVPDFTEENDDNTDYSSSKGKLKKGEIRYRVSGELWRGEWIESAEKSCRIGYSEPDEDFDVWVDGSGEKISLKSMYYEEVGKYLWFKPDLINKLTSSRGGSLKWYTQETGGVSGSPDESIHFGVNKEGLLNAYAYDVAKLRLWERRIWAGSNVKPDGGVCHELLMAQMECKPAETISPEKLFPQAVEWLQKCFKEKMGVDLFSEHHDANRILKKIHRFRSLDEDGLRGLGKDVVRYAIERIGKKPLMTALELKESKLGTLKLLEMFLSSITDEDYAKTRMAPLFGVYDLRGVDAHLPSADIEDMYNRIGIDRSLSFIHQGEMLIGQVADTIGTIGGEVRAHAKTRLG